jgi:electron transfer flavoprotein alpha subunit
MLAVIPVRDGVLPSGAAEAVAECAGRALLVGTALDSDGRDDLGDVHALLDELSGEGAGLDVTLVGLGPFGPAGWAERLAQLISDIAGEETIVLPASPDGRDLAARLAHRLGRPIHAGAVAVSEGRVTVSRRGGLELHTFHEHVAIVATLQPGVRGVLAAPGEPRTARRVDAPAERIPVPADAAVVAVHPPDVATIDLAEAPRILGGGAGLDGAERFDQLARIAGAIGASTGATRVVTDRGWIRHERQIGTTGVVVDPELYVAFGISGAVQHTSGLGDPRHVISVNTDPHCPMMQLADLAVVADANAVLDELERQLEERIRG